MTRRPWGGVKMSQHFASACGVAKVDQVKMNPRLKHLRHPLRTAAAARNLLALYLNIESFGDRSHRHYRGDARYDPMNVSNRFTSRPEDPLWRRRGVRTDLFGIRRSRTARAVRGGGISGQRIVATAEAGQSWARDLSTRPAEAVTACKGHAPGR